MPLDSTPWWKYIERDLDDIPDAPSYPGLKPGTADDFANLRKFIELNKQTNTPRSKQARRNFGPMPARGSKRGRVAPSRRSTKRKAPRGKKRTIKRKAPIRKSTKRKKRKVSKGVTLTVGTARERRVDHVQYNASSALYIPMNSIGPKNEMLKMVAQSLMLHYMHRVGDYRANASMVPTGGDIADAAASSQTYTWSHMNFSSVSYAATDDKASFTMWSNYDGSTLSEQTLTQLTDRLESQLLLMVKAGRRITQVSVFRSDNDTGADQFQCILNDISAGRNVLEFTCKASLKMQNITPADVTHTDAQTCGHDNALNINRNPLDGLVYKFRNQVPKFKMQYLISKTDAHRTALDALSDCYSTHEAGIAPVDMVVYGDEWKVPPPSPSTIFANFSGKTGISIAPGGHATQSMYESYKGPLNSFFERYFPVRLADGNAFQVPPGGSSLMVCLKPKYRNATQAALKIEAEIDHTYCARVSRAKLTPLPMNTVLA